MQQDEWDVRFYEDHQGNEPVRDWLEGGVSEPGKLAAIAAIEEVLIPRGIDVCDTEWGKNLKQGLYELRIRHSAAEIEQLFGAEPIELDSDEDEHDLEAGEGDQSVLLRIYFMTAGRKVILLVAGYDKGRYGGGKREQKAIAIARKRIRDEKERQRNQKAQRRKGR